MERLSNKGISRKITVFFLIVILHMSFINLIYASSTRPNIEGPSGTQVNSWNGNFFLQRTDLYISGQGLPLDITFFYNSSRTYNNLPFGAGWSFKYSMCYTVIGDEVKGNENKKIQSKLSSIKTQKNKNKPEFNRKDNAKGKKVVIERGDGKEDTFTWNGTSYDSPTGVFDVLEEYQSDKYKLTTKYGLIYFFDNYSHKKLTKIQDTNGNTITLTYNGNELTTITDQSGRSLSLSYSNGCLSEIIDAISSPTRTISYQYNEYFLTQVTNPLGNNTNYSYGTWGNITSLTDTNGNTTNITYSQKAVSNISNATTNQSIVYTNTQTTVTKFGNQTIYRFDTDGRVIKITDPLGNSIYKTYDINNNVTSYTDANGNTTSYTYDDKGNILTDTNASGTTSYTYDPTFNKVTSIVDKNSNTTSYTYDGTGNLININHPLGISELFTYDANGNMTSYTDGESHTTIYGYDANGNITDITYPIGSESYVYDNTGNMTSYTNANGQTTNYSFDKLDRLINVSSLAGNVTYNYDAMGNLTSIHNSNGHTTTQTYNSQNLISSETDPIGNITSYSYDSYGNVISKTDANGNVTNYTYDAKDRLIAQSYLGNSETFSYDAYGNMTGASNNEYNLSYIFDSQNRLISKTCNTIGKSISYTYDAMGNRLTMTDPDGGVTSYSYDANYRLISLTNPNSQTTSFTYNNAGMITRQDNANGTYSTYSYDSAIRLTALHNYNSSGTVISSYDYTYDNAGNRLSMTDKNGGLNSYIYDSMEQISDVNYADGGTENFTYDNWGNRTQLVKDGSPTNYTYDDADRIQTSGAISYTFDNNGNMISKTDNGNTTTYSYDGENHLIMITFPDHSANTFTYYPNEIVASKTNKLGITLYYFHDGPNTLLDINSEGSTTARYTSGLETDQWISMDKNSTSYFYHGDALGSITGLSNTNEAIVQSYDYDVFGEIKNEIGSIENPYCFTGREYDTESELYYYRSRYYDAKIGRFCKKDIWDGKIQRPLTLNSFIYVENSPVTFKDPLGFLRTGDIHIPKIPEDVRKRQERLEREKREKEMLDKWEKKIKEQLEKKKKEKEKKKIKKDDDDGGDDKKDTSVPVTLSSFTASIVSGLPTLNWETQSESNNIGWNIYRSETDNINDGLKITDEMIEGAGSSTSTTEYTYSDQISVQENTRLYYWIESVEYSGNTELFGPVDITINIQPDDSTPPAIVITGLHQNYPNPFNPITEIKFALKNPGNAELTIYNIKGQKVITLFKDYVNANEYVYAKWNGKDSQQKEVASGFYMYKLETEQKTYLKKMLLLK